MSAGPGPAIAVALAATTVYHVGIVVEKRALRQLPAIDARRAVALVKTLASAPSWLAGFALMLCGLALQVLALTLAPVSVVQPVLGSGVVILVVLSRVVLRERLGRAELACVLTVVAAIAAIAISAVGSADTVGRAAAGPWIAAVAAPACVVALVLGASALRPQARRKHRLPAVGVSYGLASGLLYGVATLAIKAVAGILIGPRASAAGLVLKVAASPYPYLALACSAVAMLIFQTGLQRCRAAIVAPVSNITGSVFFMIAGTFLFGEQLPPDPVRLLLRLGGIAAACAAVAVLSRQPAGTDAVVARRPVAPAAPAGYPAAPVGGIVAAPDESWR